MHIHTHTYIYTYMHTHSHRSTHINIHTYLQKYTHVHPSPHTHIADREGLLGLWKGVTITRTMNGEGMLTDMYTVKQYPEEYNSQSESKGHFKKIKGIVEQGRQSP